MKTAVSTPKAPAAIGPYSQAIAYGNLFYTSGQMGMDPATVGSSKQRISGSSASALAMATRCHCPPDS